MKLDFFPPNRKISFLYRMSDFSLPELLLFCFFGQDKGISIDHSFGKIFEFKKHTTQKCLKITIESPNGWIGRFIFDTV